jgi:hypothetical protein
LAVSDEVAPEIEAYAKAHPEIGITWVIDLPAQETPAATESQGYTRRKVVVPEEVVVEVVNEIDAIGEGDQ